MVQLVNAAVQGTIAAISSVGGGSIGITGVVSMAGTASVTGTVNFTGLGGVPNTPTGAVNALSTSVTLLDANASRYYAAFSNLGGTPVYLAMGSPAINVSGIRLNTGALYEMTSVNRFLGTITGISAGGTVPVGVISW